MKKSALVSITLFLLSVSAAVAQDVRYHFDNNADFSKFKTYKWIPIIDAGDKDAAKVDDLLYQQVKDAVDAELAKKGLRKTDADTADLSIGYLAGFDTEIQLFQPVLPPVSRPLIISRS